MKHDPIGFSGSCGRLTTMVIVMRFIQGISIVSSKQYIYIYKFMEHSLFKDWKLSVFVFVPYTLP